MYVLGKVGERSKQNSAIFPIQNNTIYVTTVLYYLIKNSQAVKKGAAPIKAMVKKRCEIQGGGQEMAVMVC